MISDLIKGIEESILKTQIVDINLMLRFFNVRFCMYIF